MSMELVVTEIKQQDIKIKNKEEILKYLDESLAKYNKVLTEDMIAEGKGDRAKLNKFITSIEDRRKDVKKMCLMPYESIEKDFKEITGKVEIVKNKLDVQLKAFEENKKAEKKQELIKFYKENVDELKQLITFEKLFNEHMLNATYSSDIAKQEIKENIERIRADLVVITDLKSEFEIQLKDYYLNNLDLSRTLQEKTRLEKQKEAFEKAKKQDDEAICVKAEETTKTVIENDAKEIIYHRAFEVWGNEKQIIELGEFMSANGIKFKKIEGVE